MELWLTLVALYGVQCLLHLSSSELLFVRPLLGWRVTAGPGWRLAHPLDAAAAAVSSRLPLVDDGAGGLSGLESPNVWGLRPVSRPRPRFVPARGISIESRGHVVRLDGAPFYRAATRSGATRLADLLADLVRAGPLEVEDRLRQEIASSLSLEGYRRESARLRDAGWLLNVATWSYLALFFVGLPVTLILAGDERGLLLALPVLAAAHILTLVAMTRTHAALLPGEAGRRFEDVLAAAVYPPLLLRAHATFRLEVLGRFHPAVHAAERLEGAARRDFLRAELARVELAFERGDGARIPALEQSALRDLLHACGESRESVFVAPSSGGSSEDLSYCPICSCEYRFGGVRCVDCGARLLPLAPQTAARVTPPPEG